MQAIVLPASMHPGYLYPARILGSRDIDFVFTGQAGQGMQQATEANIGHPMGITVDGKLVSFAAISGITRNCLEMPAGSAAEAQALIDQFALKK